MRHSAVGVLAFILILVFFGAGANVALQDSVDSEHAREETTVENETIIVDYANETSVQRDAAKYNETVTVLNATEGELEAGEDYEWHPDRGNVSWFDTNATSEGENASITYTAYDPPQETQQLEALLTPFITLLPYVFLAVCAFAALSATNDGWGWS